MSQNSEEILRGRGYVVLEDHFDPAQALKVVEQRVKEYVADGGQAFSGGFRPDVMGDRISEVMVDPVLLAVGQEVLGQRPAFGSFGCNSVPHGTEGMDAHFDYPYFAMGRSLPKTGDPALCLQLIWYLVDVTEDSGPTLVVPGTQTRPRRPTKDFRKRAKAITAKAGSVFVGHGALWHGVGENTSGRLRHALLGSYVPFWVQPMLVSSFPGRSPEMRSLLREDFGLRIGEGYLDATEKVRPRPKLTREEIEKISRETKEDYAAAKAEAEEVGRELDAYSAAKAEALSRGRKH